MMSRFRTSVAESPFSARRVRTELLRDMALDSSLLIVETRRKIERSLSVPKRPPNGLGATLEPKQEVLRRKRGKQMTNAANVAQLISLNTMRLTRSAS